MQFRWQKKTKFWILAVTAVLFLLLALPLSWSEGWRSRWIHALASSSAGGLAFQEKLAALELENHLLALRATELEIHLEQYGALLRQKDRWRQHRSGDLEGHAFLERRAEEADHMAALAAKMVPAKVIYRDPASWSSALWVDVGRQDNLAWGEEVIAKNSPVVLGLDVVGVVDYVGERQSRIRLITDSGLCPSVRASRGVTQGVYWANHVEALLEAMDQTLPVGVSGALVEELMPQLVELREELLRIDTGHHLAKGEVRGSGRPLWRARGERLRGVGFNYDFADAEGPARDLRSGRAIWQNQSLPLSLIQEGDLLMTTGMDGVFPAGLFVASVDRVHVLREGSSTYEVEAIPRIAAYGDLSWVFILPAVSSDSPGQVPR